MMTLHNQEDDYLCPSFSIYSADELAGIAIKVAMEDLNDVAEEDGDFEFTLIPEDEEFAAYNGQNFPVFNRNFATKPSDDRSTEAVENLTVPLGNIFIDQINREENEQSDQINADELETYCVWRPKTAAPPSPTLCKKSKSTGSTSKSWNLIKLRDLLRRSNSEGKGYHVFLTRNKCGLEKKQKSKEASKDQKRTSSSAVSGGRTAGPSPHEAFYVRNREVNAENKKKSYLPYRRGLVGFFTSVNGFSRSLPLHF